MSDTDFGKSITRAARAVARIELKRRKLRKQLAELEAEYRAAQTQLRTYVQAVEPYAPPEPGAAQAANDAIDGRV